MQGSRQNTGALTNVQVFVGQWYNNFLLLQDINAPTELGVKMTTESVRDVKLHWPFDLHQVQDSP